MAGAQSNSMAVLILSLYAICRARPQRKSIPVLNCNPVESGILILSIRMSSRLSPVFRNLISGHFAFLTFISSHAVMSRDSFCELNHFFSTHNRTTNPVIYFMAFHQRKSAIDQNDHDNIGS
jgi:hypothetical protein